MHFSSFGNATDGVSLSKTVCRLLVESLSPRSFFSKFKATVISASNSVLFMPHGSAYTDSKGRILAKVRNFGLLGQRTDDTEPTTANDSFEKWCLNSLIIRSRIGMINSTRMASDVTTSSGQYRWCNSSLAILESFSYACQLDCVDPELLCRASNTVSEHHPKCQSTKKAGHEIPT